MDKSSVLSMDYPCKVYYDSKVFDSAQEVFLELLAKTGNRALAAYQANMLKFSQNASESFTLINAKSGDVLTGDPDVDSALLMCREFILSQAGAEEDKLLTAKIHVENDIIMMETEDGYASYNVVDKRIACAYMRMNESEFYYSPGDETTIEYHPHLLDEITFVDILSDIQSFHADEPDMIDYLSKDMVRYFLRDQGYDAGEQALIYCGF